MTLIFIPMLPTMFGRRYQVCKHLVEAGHEVHMIVWDMPYPITLKTIRNNFVNAWRAKTYLKDGIKVHKVRRLPFFFPIINRLLFRSQVKNIADKCQATAVISQSFFNETEPPNNIPLYFDLNDNYVAFANIYGSFVYKLSYKFLRVRHTVESQLRRAEGVFAVSDLLMDYGRCFNTNVCKIPNGVEKEFTHHPIPIKLSYGNHSLVYVSNFGVWSRVLELIHAVHELKNDYSNIHLVLIGEGTEYLSAKKLVKQLKLDLHIDVLGPIYNRRRLVDIISNCAVGINISEKNEFRDSASPIKLFEYSALGKPVISTNLKEVLQLNFPNVSVYDSAHESDQLVAAIRSVFNGAHKNNTKIRQIIRDEYSWPALINNMVEHIKVGLYL